MRNTEFTAIGNNIFQCFIRENKRNGNAPFAILPRERFEGLMKAYTHYSPDIIALQECDEGWHDLLNSPEGLPSLGYTAATECFIERPTRLVRNVIYCKADKFSVEAAGYSDYEGTGNGRDANPWCYSWAILCHKESGKRFAVTSTHLIWVSIDNWEMRDRFAHQLAAFIDGLCAEYGLPAVAIGDYNAHVMEPAYSTMKTRLLSAREAADERINMEYKSTNRLGCPPDLDTDGRGVVDHCFITPGRILPKKYELLVDPMTYAYSDHLPHRLTFEVL